MERCDIRTGWCNRADCAPDSGERPCLVRCHAVLSSILLTMSDLAAASWGAQGTVGQLREAPRQPLQRLHPNTMHRIVGMVHCALCNSVHLAMRASRHAAAFVGDAAHEELPLVKLR